MTNIMPDERLVIRLPYGTKRRIREYSRRNKIKNISVMARDLILKELKAGKEQETKV